MRKRVDGLIVTYSVVGLSALVVSAPATYRLVSLYHSDGSQAGVVAAVALLVILEAGAVAAKIATLWATEARRWLLTFTFAALGINTLSNLIHGGAVATANGLGWLPAWGGALVYAAALPAVLYMMLHLICDRVRWLWGIERTTADEVAHLLMPVAHAVEVARQASQSLATLAPPPQLVEPQVSYARPEAVAAPEAAQPVLMLPETCPACGQAPTRMQLRTAAQHQGWTCKGCGRRVSPQ